MPVLRRGRVTRPVYIERGVQMTKEEKYLKWLENALVKEENIKIDKVILFGSYAKGTNREDSDIDLAIVSSDFSEETCIATMELLLSKANALEADIQTIPFTIEEYNNLKGIIEEVLKTGIELKVA